MVKKRKAARRRAESGIARGPIPNDKLTFSFEFFDRSDPEVCPASFPDGYVQTLMERLRSLSSWTAGELVANRSAALRSHPVRWEDTSKPDGFARLPDQVVEGATPYQFSLTSNEHGRVFGLLIGSTFHIVWLDQRHNVYPGRG